ITSDASIYCLSSLAHTPQHRHAGTSAHVVFFITDSATAVIYTLSLHDALPICKKRRAATLLGRLLGAAHPAPAGARFHRQPARPDRKSTRLNSSHLVISYAVFCLKKKKFMSYDPDAAVKHRRAADRVSRPVRQL